jgi:hypothetical protein
VVLRGAWPWVGGDGAGGGAGFPRVPPPLLGGCARQGSPVGLVAGSAAPGGLRAVPPRVGAGGWAHRPPVVARFNRRLGGGSKALAIGRLTRPISAFPCQSRGRLSL